MQLQEDRKHALDLNKMTPADADQVSKQLGDRLRVLVDECVGQANRLLNVYGLEGKMQIVIQEINAPKEAPKRRTRAKKKQQS